MEIYKTQDRNLSDKERVWETEKKLIEEVTDARGKRVDEGIKETTIALSAMKINVFSSCEGHLDRGTEAPYVDIESALVNELDKKLKKATTKEEAKELEKKIVHANLKESQKAMDLLEEFYQGRNVPYYRRIIINPRARFWSRLESQGAGLQKIVLDDIKAQRLKEFQEEMKAFAEFVKKKFFSEK